MKLQLSLNLTEDLRCVLVAVFTRIIIVQRGVYDNMA